MESFRSFFGAKPSEEAEGQTPDSRPAAEREAEKETTNAEVEVAETSNREPAAESGAEDESPPEKASSPQGSSASRITCDDAAKMLSHVEAGTELPPIPSPSSSLNVDALLVTSVASVSTTSKSAPVQKTTTGNGATSPTREVSAPVQPTTTGRAYHHSSSSSAAWSFLSAFSS
ncbi:hypothetical protein PR003_g15346 [Phytophthora rubi]|uniref:Uncharacterized protein n=1 Tax=Phytophthora rubi TaxID=129364 RepID=A0A6A4EZ02_9STRA|nr:hypothetical protein PR002_g11122 [Phytophthora rubi]KAE9330301.1 hypothetical protein PR003_g15346 [Phytophthora rubi]